MKNENQNQLDIFAKTQNETSSNKKTEFRNWFEQIYQNPPFIWQERLFQQFIEPQKFPSALALPTGLGKTSVMCIWLLARAINPALPRRLVYIVDRRVVVDQATLEAEKIQKAVAEIPGLADSLGLQNRHLPVSTLRGQLADNQEWLQDPSLPAILVGTIDMIGSRLLFSGYGVSRGMRPYHAGLLGVDSLFVLDEAHLCPPFQSLLETICRSHKFAPTGEGAAEAIPKTLFLPLSATGREIKERNFQIEAEDFQDALVKQRLNARKRLVLINLDTGKNLDEAIAERAWNQRGEASRVLVYCNSRKDAVKVEKQLRDKNKNGGQKVEIELLTGARRVLERETLLEKLESFGFIAGSRNRLDRPVFLVATSAGEVGVNLDADFIVCDLVSFERMVQRLGRVNRLGLGDATIYVYFIQDDAPSASWLNAMELLPETGPKAEDLPEGTIARDASPAAFENLKEQARQNPNLAKQIAEATSSEPLRPELTRAVVDAWSMTSLKVHAGRPEIEPWLRGWVEKDEPETTVIWRQFLPWPKDASQPDPSEIEAYFDAAPRHITETLDVPTSHVVDVLLNRAKTLLKQEEKDKKHDPAILVLDSAGQSRAIQFRGQTLHGLTVGHFADLDKYNKEALKKALIGATLVISRDFGGLSEAGLLDSSQEGPAKTVDHGWPESLLTGAVGYRVRLRQGVDDKGSTDWHSVFGFELTTSEGEGEPESILVEVYRGKNASRQGDPAVSRWEQELQEHLEWTGNEALLLGRNLKLPESYQNLLKAGALAHDLGKARELWQLAMNARPRFSEGIRIFMAKTIGGGNPRLLGGYRHEFGSLGDAESCPDIQALPEELKDLALHLIASHHGYARPVIAAIDPDKPPSLPEVQERAQQAALRFARLQKYWGPWGLAWWEAVFRAADQRASRKLDAQADREKI